MHRVAYDAIPPLLPLALVGIGVVFWLLAPVGCRSAKATRARRRVIAIVFGAMLMLGLLFTSTGDPRRWRIFAPAEDGGWRVTTIDGRNVASLGYSLAFEDRKIAGGRDGCNGWSYTDDRPSPDGSRMIVQTLVECPEDDPARRAYWSLAGASDLGLEPTAPDMLRLSARGHNAMLHRR